MEACVLYREGEGIVIGSLNGYHMGTVEDALHQLVDGSGCRYEENDVKTVGSPCAAHCRSRISGGCQRDLIDAMGHGLGCDELTCPVLEGAGGKLAVQLEIKTLHSIALTEPDGPDQRCASNGICILILYFIGEEVVEGNTLLILKALKLLLIVND